jgi:hypothetical protein
VQQQLFHFEALVSYYIHYVSIFAAALTSISNLSPITRAASFNSFSAIVSYYLEYVNICCSAHFIFQHWTHITYTMLNDLQPLVQFTALLSYYLNCVNMCCSGYFILQPWSRIIYNSSTWAAPFNSFFSTDLVLPKLCQNMLQRLIHFQQWPLISYPM